MTSVQREFTISNREGLHARPAARFVRLCSSMKSEVLVEKEDEQVNGKSIMGLMMLAAGKGDKIKITIEGEDAPQAMEKLGGLIERGFEEE